MTRPLMFLTLHGARANEKILINLEGVEEVHEIKEGGKYKPVLEDEKAAKALVFTKGHIIPVRETYRQILNQMQTLGRR